MFGLSEVVLLPPQMYKSLSLSLSLIETQEDSAIKNFLLKKLANYIFLDFTPLVIWVRSGFLTDFF